MALATGKIVEVMFEKVKETYEHQMQLLDLTDFHEPDGGSMQNAGNVVWYPVQQHRPRLSGWSLTGQELGIVEETYPAILGTPENDLVEQRADDMRDLRFWERSGEESGRQQATGLNSDIASAITTQAGMFIRSTATSGYNFIAEAQAVMNERQLKNTERKFLLNDRDNLTFGSDLAGRQTLQGRPETTWTNGQIGQNVAGFDVYTGSYLPNLAGGANPSTQVSAVVSEKPEGGTVNTATGVVTNVDYRIATIAVVASASYNVGDKVTFRNRNPGTTVKALGLADKNDTGQAMTFTIVAKPTSTSVSIYPKPIAYDDAALSDLEKAYANIDTQIEDGAHMERMNIDTSNRVNLFYDKSAVEVIGGTIPAQLFSQYDGMKVITDTLSNGLQLYMVYDGDMITMTFRYRIFTWFGITICNPSNCGVAVTHTGSAPTTLAPTTTLTSVLP